MEYVQSEMVYVGILSYLPNGAFVCHPVAPMFYLVQIVTYIYIVNKYGRLYAAVQLLEALRYKPEGRGFDSRWC
jgi:hypothetical protein